MNLHKTLSYLKEELTDIPASVDNIHYTTIEHLFRILDTGKLIGGKYHISTFKSKKRGIPELCTVRSSRAKELDSKDRSTLSDNASGPVKIYLFTNRILSSVRGIKKAPIAELPIASKNNIDHYKSLFKENFGIDCPVIATREDSVKISYFPERREGDKYQEETYDKIMDALKKIKLDKDSKAERIAIYLNNAICDNFADLKNRESEERFVFNASNGIPIKPELMKIEIFPGWEDELDDIVESGYVDIEYGKKFYNLLTKYENCFNKNKEFLNFKNAVKKLSEGAEQ